MTAGRWNNTGARCASWSRTSAPGRAASGSVASSSWRRIRPAIGRNTGNTCGATRSGKNDSARHPAERSSRAGVKFPAASRPVRDTARTHTPVFSYVHVMKQARTGSTLRYALVLSLPAFAVLGGCGSSSPTAPSPGAAAAVTPTPSGPTRTTLSLNAAADQQVYSSSLTWLGPGQSFSVDFKLDRINSTPTAQFHYAIEFWLAKTADAAAADPSSDGAVLSLYQAQDATWNVWVRTPGDIYRSSGYQTQVAVGASKTLRVVRGPDGALAFYLDGVSPIGLGMYKEPAFVFARVVGTGATFSFVQGATSTSVGSASSALFPR